jgi:hypothetical protein
MSTPRIIKARVPQGSVLSPTLFNMYINDTPQAIGVHLALFADDTCLYGTDRKEDYVLRNFSVGSTQWWSGPNAGTLGSMNIRRRRSTFLIKLDRLSLFLQ